MNCLFLNEALGNNLIRNPSCICRETQGDNIHEALSQCRQIMTTSADSSNNAKEMLDYGIIFLSPASCSFPNAQIPLSMV